MLHWCQKWDYGNPFIKGKHTEEVQRNFIPRRLFNGELAQRTSTQDLSLGRADGASMPRFLGEELRPPPLEGPQAEDPGAYSWPLHPLRPALSRDPEQRPTMAEPPRWTNTKLPRYNGENPLETYLVGRGNGSSGGAGTGGEGPTGTGRPAPRRTSKLARHRSRPTMQIQTESVHR